MSFSPEHLHKMQVQMMNMAYDAIEHAQKDQRKLYKTIQAEEKMIHDEGQHSLNILNLLISLLACCG